MILTGTRAEYGILKPVISQIVADPILELRLVVSGLHLSRRHGYSLDVIRSDGFEPDWIADVFLSDDSLASYAQSAGLAILQFVQPLTYIKPDLLLVCGDRVEAFAGAVAASFLRIPVAHLFGGDSASGSNIDDSIRHSITRFAHIHFAATHAHQARLLAMGEEGWRVFHVGSPALDVVSKLLGSQGVHADHPLYSWLQAGEPYVIVLQHPTSLNHAKSYEEMRATLGAALSLGQKVLVIYPNSDPGSDGIIRAIEESRNHPQVKIVKNMPHDWYVQALIKATILIGNSSSGLIETPLLRIPVIDIGPRQEGRERGANVLRCAHSQSDIAETAERALSDPVFQAAVQSGANPFGDGKASPTIVRILRDLEINAKLLAKRLTI